MAQLAGHPQIATRTHVVQTSRVSRPGTGVGKKMASAPRARKADVSDTSSDEEDDVAPEPAAPADKAPVASSFLEPAERGEKIVFTDDDDEDPQPAAKKPRPAPPPRRIAVASGKTVVSICNDLAEEHSSVHLFPLCWQLPRPGGNVTVQRISDEDDVNYNIGSLNVNSKIDPERGGDLGCAELVGLASVAGEIVHVLSEDPDAVAVISDPWGSEYAPFVAYLAQRLYSVKHRGARSITGGVRRPKNASLKNALKAIGKATSVTQMRGALREFYKDSF